MTAGTGKSVRTPAKAMVVPWKTLYFFLGRIGNSPCDLLCIKRPQVIANHLHIVRFRCHGASDNQSEKLITGFG